MPEIKAHRSEDDVPVLRKMQLQLLKSVWSVLRPGGELVYSTCSILRSENDNVIDTFVKRNADAHAAEVPFPKARDDRSDVFVHRRKHGALLFLPSTAHQGGYIALLRKQDSAP